MRREPGLNRFMWPVFWILTFIIKFLGARTDERNEGEQETRKYLDGIYISFAAFRLSRYVLCRTVRFMIPRKISFRTLLAVYGAY